MCCSVTAQSWRTMRYTSLPGGLLVDSSLPPAPVPQELPYSCLAVTSTNMAMHPRVAHSTQLSHWQIIFFPPSEEPGSSITWYTSDLAAVRTVGKIYSHLITQDSQPRLHERKNRIKHGFMAKGIITDFHGSFGCHTTAESSSGECSYGRIQWFQSKILILFLPYLPSTSTNISPGLFGKRNKLFIKMTLSIVLKKNKKVNLKLNHKPYKELFMKPLLRGSVPNERKTITSERIIKASNLYTSFQSTD